MPQVKKTIEKKVSHTIKKKSESALSVEVYNTKGKVVETIDLPPKVFGAKINKPLIGQAIRVYLANQRQGTVSTKTRGEVAGSTRKIWKQKGTGRARHGSIRAPIFVHGGLAFGPKPRDFSKNLPKKMKKAALYCALSAKLKDKEITVLTGLDSIEPKTKVMAQVIKSLPLEGKRKKILLVIPENLQNVIRASRNLEGIVYTSVQRLHTYQVLDNSMIVFMKETIPAVEKETQKETIST